VHQLFQDIKKNSPYGLFIYFKAGGQVSAGDTHTQKGFFMRRKMKKVFLFLGLVIFSILAMSCDIKTNYPAESTGKFFVHNGAESGKTITRIVVTSTGGLCAASTYYSERANIQPGSKSPKVELVLSHSNYVSTWNQFRVTVTLDNGSTAYVNIKIYEDTELNLRYDGANLVQD
jgi:hypothetical protein